METNTAVETNAGQTTNDSGVNQSVEQNTLNTNNQSVVGKTPSAEGGESLITRVSKVELKPKETVSTENPFGLTKEDYEIAQKDPVLSKIYKSMQSDYTKKTQTAAQIKQEAERLKAESSNWTPEKIQSLMNDPKFVQAAQTVAQQQAPLTYKGNEQEWSALSDTEKAKFQDMQNEINILKQQNFQASKVQEDTQLKQKYADYAPDVVDTTVSQLIRGEVKASREDIWKVINYEKDMQRAYELGKQDSQSNNKTKIDGMSFDAGRNTVPNKEIPQIEKGETNNAYFKRITLNNLAKMTPSR